MLTLIVVLLSLIFILMLAVAVAAVRAAASVKGSIARAQALLQRVETLLAEDGQVIHVLGGAEAVIGMLMGELANLHSPLPPPPRTRDCR
jgi:hypothetical protein